ncbi:hypothetical protein F4780DRAFT_632664 [Xylariomycetidae sp. FL0641]|nr:hypothetical protein F4780DRAFT_632664 [Xylariomycetidae sp. FL0641]
MADRPEFKRRFGKYDFERFDHLSPEQASIGGGLIGKVHVDCRFLFSKSRWGVLGGDNNPAGIVYLDLHVSQPEGCRLRNVTITVTLDDEDEQLQCFQKSGSTMKYGPVQLTPWYGPQYLTGQPRHALVGSKNSLTPYIEAGGMVGVGGIGKESQTLRIKESRWTFRGHQRPARGGFGYKVLRWELTENGFEEQPTRRDTMHTAFAFQHNRRALFMRVEVSGRLESVSDQILYKFKRFPASRKNRDRGVTTLINFVSKSTSRQPPDQHLDELAVGLDRAMQEANLQQVSTEIPRARATSLYGTEEAIHRPFANFDSVSGQSFPSRADSRAAAMESKEGGEHSAVEDPTEPTQENLAQAFMHLALFSNAGRGPFQADQATFNTSSTPQSPQSNTPPSPKQELYSRKEVFQEGEDNEGAQPDLESTMVLLKITGLLTVLQAIIVTLRYWGVKLAPTSQKTEARGEPSQNAGADAKGTQGNTIKSTPSNEEAAQETVRQ